MKVKELIEKLNQIDDKEKDVYIYLHSPYGNEYDLCTDKINIEEEKYSVDLTD